MIRRALFAVLISALGMQSALAVCNVAGPPYNLTSDTVEWMLIIASGQSCTRGLRSRTAVLDSVAVTTVAQHGYVVIRGSGFEYRANPDFKGDDSFEITLSGMNVRVPGNSTIRVLVSVR
jgi:hypothetical protein